MTVAGGGLYASNPMFGIRVGCISVWKPNASRPKIDAQMIAYVAMAALVFLVWMSDGAKSQVALCAPDRVERASSLRPARYQSQTPNVVTLVARCCIGGGMLPMLSYESEEAL